jgi:hypothetical protein
VSSECAIEASSSAEQSKAKRATLSKCISRFSSATILNGTSIAPGTYFTRLGTSLKHTETTSAVTTIKLESIADITETEHFIFDTEAQCVA